MECGACAIIDYKYGVNPAKKLCTYREFINKKYKIIYAWTEQGVAFWFIKTQKYIKCVPKYGLYNPCVEKEKEKI